MCRPPGLRKYWSFFPVVYTTGKYVPPSGLRGYQASDFLRPYHLSLLFRPFRVFRGYLKGFNLNYFRMLPRSSILSAHQTLGFRITRDGLIGFIPTQRTPQLHRHIG